MTRSLRWRLQLWHAVILAAAVLTFGTAFYQQLRRSTLGEIDAELLSGARVLEGTLRALPPPMRDRALANLPLELPMRPPGRGPGPPPPDRESGELPLPGGPPSTESRPNGLPRAPGFMTEDLPGPPDTSLYYAIFSGSGALLRANSAAPDRVQKVRPETRRPLEYRNIDRRREVLLRGPDNMLIIVGRDVQRIFSRLQQSLIQLVLIGAAVLGLGLVGGWWLAGKAIRPIRKISETAGKVNASTLSERIDTERMDEELRSLGTTLNSMLNRLEQSFQQQSQFTADASHELRTPISVLLSHCELALNRPRSEKEYRQTLQTCQTAGERMKELVERLLILARADAGKLELQKTDVDLHELAAEAVEMFAPFAGERHVTLMLAGESARCWADAARISQVITNLVHNSVVHHGEAGQVNVSTSMVDGRATLQVRDDGPGIPPAALPRLFDRFYRVDEARSRAESGHRSGSGLGLAICRSIIDAHGGSLTASSEPGVGSVFQFSIPGSA